MFIMSDTAEETNYTNKIDKVQAHQKRKCFTFLHTLYYLKQFRVKKKKNDNFVPNIAIAVHIPIRNIK